MTISLGMQERVVVLGGRTTASCSFSHSRYNSAAVNGRGCLSGTAMASLLMTMGLRGL